MSNDQELTVADIIERAGGAAAIARASAEQSDGTVTADAARKWGKNGIPDRHWPLVMGLAGTTADQMLAANVVARGAGGEQAAADSDQPVVA